METKIKNGTILKREISHCEEPFERAIDVARFYGFSLLEPIKALQNARSLENYISPDEKRAVLKTYLNLDMPRVRPAMLCHSKSGDFNEREFHLNIINSNKSVAEALIIQTAIAILNEYGNDNLFIDINSLGNKKSFSSFSRELGTYYRKNIKNVCSHCKTKYKKNMLRVFECRNNKCAGIKEESPKSVSYLNEDDRRHLKEILEYLEVIGIPYRINNHLLGTNESPSHTVFKIYGLNENLDPDAGTMLARGERHYHLFRGEIVKNRIPSVHVSIKIIGKKKKNEYEREKKEIPAFDIGIKRMKKSAYFIQFGLEAKLKSFGLLEKLRKENLFIFKSIMEDCLANQIMEAEELNVSHAVIMGAKEARENSVIIRNMKTQAQEIIGIENLSCYLKKLVK